MYQTNLFWYTILVLDTLEPESIFLHFITITQESPILFFYKTEESPNLYTDIPENATKNGNMKSETRKAIHPTPYQHKHLIYNHLQAQ